MLYYCACNSSSYTVTAVFKQKAASKTTVYARAELTAQSNVDANGNGTYDVRVWLSTNKGLSSDVSITGGCTISLTIAGQSVTLNSMSSGESKTTISKNSSNYPGLNRSNAGGMISINSVTLPSSYTNTYSVSIL